MKKQDGSRTTTKVGRRRFLALFGSLGALGLSLPWMPRRRQRREQPLREADFYRPHDLAG
jgi:hypothetical protein